MIKRLEVTNYRTLTDFQVELSHVSLLMGSNGTGKTSVMDVLDAIQRLVVRNATCTDCFPMNTLSRWLMVSEGSPTQDFSLTLGTKFGDLEYRLSVMQYRQEAFSIILRESLRDSGGMLFSFLDGNVKSYHDDHDVDAEFKYDMNRSALAGIARGYSNQKLTHFKERMAQIACIRVDAPRIHPRSEKEDPFPERDFGNFASWYRSAIGRNAAAVGPFIEEMKAIIPGFQSLNLFSLGQGHSLLQCQFARDSAERTSDHRRRASEYPLDFNELSDGQRTLIVLYAALHFMMKDGAILFIDEPENFLALEEVQPFIHRLLDQVELFEDCQVILTSHHPKFYNALATDYGIKLSRDPQGNVVTERFVAPPDSALPVSELIARGEIS